MVQPTKAGGFYALDNVSAVDAAPTPSRSPGSSTGNVTPITLGPKADRSGRQYNAFQGPRVPSPQGNGREVLRVPGPLRDLPVERQGESSTPKASVPNANGANYWGDFLRLARSVVLIGIYTDMLA